MYFKKYNIQTKRGLQKTVRESTVNQIQHSLLATTQITIASSDKTLGKLLS